MQQVRRVTTGNPWEKEICFSRAVRVGDMVYTAGTIAADESGTIHGEDSYSQCCYILNKLAVVLEQLGSGLNDVVKVTCYLKDLGDAEGFSRAHAEFFGEVRPATTCIAVSDLFGDGSLVELELTAYAV